jgi:branched-subunit amino acid aminotransferase/4-amino-4-deoxychorismate lyase
VKGVHAWTLVEGSFREGAAIPISDRGFRYGMSVFETVAVRNGRMLFLEEHLEALSAACKAAGFQAATGSAINALADLPDGLLRIYITAGDGGLSGSALHQRTFAYFEPGDFPGPKEITLGFRVGVTPAPFVTVLGGWKTGNYWPNVRALSQARENGFDETLIVNIERVVISAAVANVFFLIGGILHTPATDIGARQGVVRQWITRITPVREGRLSLEEISAAEECFLTNSRLGVMPVSHIEGRPLPSRDTGEALAGMYRERILRK